MTPSSPLDPSSCRRDGALGGARDSSAPIPIPGAKAAFRARCASAAVGQSPQFFAALTAGRRGGCCVLQPCRVSSRVRLSHRWSSSLIPLQDLLQRRNNSRASGAIPTSRHRQPYEPMEVHQKILEQRDVRSRIEAARESMQRARSSSSAVASPETPPAPSPTKVTPMSNLTLVDMSTSPTSTMQTAAAPRSS